MKPKIKLCSGFEDARCKTCKRLNPDAELLVKSLSINHLKIKYCIYYKP